MQLVIDDSLRLYNKIDSACTETTPEYVLRNLNLYDNIDIRCDERDLDLVFRYPDKIRVTKEAIFFQMTLLVCLVGNGIEIKMCSCNFKTSTFKTKDMWCISLDNYWILFPSKKNIGKYNRNGGVHITDCSFENILRLEVYPDKIQVYTYVFSGKGVSVRIDWSNLIQFTRNEFMKAVLFDNILEGGG